VISKRQMRKRLRQSTDTSFSAKSSTLHERLPALARAGSGASSSASRLGRRIAAVVGSFGLVGWLTVGSAGALMTVAATGSLPDPIQQFVADVVHIVGIDLPDPAQQRREDEQHRAGVSNSIPAVSSGPLTGPVAPPVGTFGSGSTDLKGAQAPDPETAIRMSADDPTIPSSPGDGSAVDSTTSTTTTQAVPAASTNTISGEHSPETTATTRPTTTTTRPPTTTTRPPTTTTTRPDGGDHEGGHGAEFVDRGAPAGTSDPSRPAIGPVANR
jgi:hypothetical protein